MTREGAPLPESQLIKDKGSQNVLSSDFRDTSKDEFEAVREWSNDFFIKVYNDGPPEEISVEFGDHVSEHIADLVGEKEAYQERLLPEKYRKGAQIFLETLISFVQQQQKHPSSREKSEKFIQNIQESLFSYSPNLSNHIGLENMILTTAKANRVPEIQGWFGQTMVGEMVYELAFCGDKRAQEIVENIQKQPISDLLDIIHQFQTIGADAIANGDWAKPAVRRIQFIITEIGRAKQSPFVGYAIQGVLDRLDSETHSPTIGVFKRHGDRREGRISEEISDERLQQHQMLAGQINPLERIEPGSRLYPIAKDAVAAFDHSDLLRSVGRVDRSSLSEAYPVSIMAVRNATEALQDERNHDQRTLSQITSFINERIVPFETTAGETNMFTHSSPQELLQYLAGVEKKMADRLTPVHFQSLESLSQDQELNPFLQTQGENTPLLLQHLHRAELRKNIEQDLGISLLDLPLRSQIHLLRFLSRQDNAGFQKLRNALQKNPGQNNDILVSFLACAEDIRYGNAILAIAERLDPQLTKAIFSKYREFVEASDGARMFLIQTFGEKGGGKESALHKIIQKLLRNGNSILDVFFDMSKIWQKSPPKSEQIQELAHVIEKQTAEIELFKSSFKVLKEEGEDIELTDINNSNLQIQSSEELKKQPEILASMKRIYEENYKNYPLEFRAKLLNAFEKRLQNSDARFYIFQYNGEIIAFDSFEDQENRISRFASFNVNERYQRSKLGEAMLVQSVDKEAQKRILEADCDPKAPMTKKYIEGGFIAVQLHDVESVPSLRIVRNDTKREHIQSKKFSQEQIVEMEYRGETVQDLVIYGVSEEHATQLPKYVKINVRAKEHDNHLRINKKEPDFSPLEQGYALTRYFTKGGKTYYVFEKLKDYVS